VVTIADDIKRRARIANQRKNLPRGGFYWERELYLSDAFLSLNKNSMKFLIAILDSRIRAKNSRGKFIKGKFINLNNLEMPYYTLEKKYKMPRGSITPALDELLAKGFLTIKKLGGIYRGDKSIYAWSDNWVMWKEGIIYGKRERDVKRGFQGKRLGAARKKKVRKKLST
jgi:hypothetical protein